MYVCITKCNVNLHVIMWLNTNYQFKYIYQFAMSIMWFVMMVAF